MTLRGTAVLILLGVALVGYLWLVEARPRLAESPPAASPLLGAPAAAVARVELAERTRRLVAARRDGRWLDANGRPWRDDAVTDLVRTLGTLAPLMVVDPTPEADADYGLDNGAARLSLLAGDGQPLLVLELGDRNPASTGLYVRRAGEQGVLLVGAVLGWELDKLRGAAPLVAAADPVPPAR
jgi:hypothetical protein